MTPNFALTFVTGLAILSTAACGVKSGQHDGNDPRRTYQAPALNETQEATLQKRSKIGDSDNYAETCVFLNASFKRMNTCAINVQNDRSIQGTQVTDQKSLFFKASGGTLENPIFEDQNVYGESLKPEEYKTGDIWLLRKSNGSMKYDMVFEINQIEDGQITVKYQVKTFAYGQ